MNCSFVRQDGDAVLLHVDLDVYSVGSLLHVAHKFTDRCYVHIQRADDRSVEVRIRGKVVSPDLEAIAGQFCNELLDQTLREKVSKESLPTRNLILAHALSRTPFVEPELETGRPFDSESPSLQ